MSETATQATSEHDSWVRSVLGIDPAQAAAAVAPAAAPTMAPTTATPAASTPADDGTGAGGFFGRVADAAKAVGRTAEAAAIAVGQTAVQVGETVANTAVQVGETVGHAVEGAAKAAHDAVFPPKPPPVKPGEVGPDQKKRADKQLAALPPEDKAKVEKIIADAPPSQKGYLEKALASRHSASEIETFHKQIAGKDEKWMRENLHLVGDSEGRGIKQQWHDSCVPTTMQAMKAELDPIYALKIRTENPDFKNVDEADGAKLNPKMAAEQKQDLENNGGVAVSRDDEGGQGVNMTTALNSHSAETGLTFDTESVTDKTVNDALSDIDATLNKGLPVPIRVGGASGGHAVLVVSMEAGPPRLYSIHDPWDGKIVKVTEDEIRKKTFNIAGWNQMTHVFKPKAA